MGMKNSRFIATAGILALILTGCGKGDADRNRENADYLASVEIKGDTETNANTGTGTDQNGGTGPGNGTTQDGGTDPGNGTTQDGSSNPGSGNGNAAGQADTGKSAWDDGPVTWQPAYFPLENDYTQVLSSGQTFYGLSERNGQTQLDSIEKETLAIEGTISLQNASLDSGMAADQDGYLYVPTAGEETGLWKIDTKSGSGEYEKIELEDCSSRNGLFLKGIRTDPEGYTYIWCNLIILGTENIDGMEREVGYMTDRVYVKDRQLKTVFYQDITNCSGVETLYFQIDGEGRPGFLVKDDREIQLREIDVAAHGLKEAVKLGTAFDCFGMEDANIPEHLTFTGRGWLYCRNNQMYEFRYDTKEKVQVLDLTAYGILSSDILFLGKGQDRITIIGRSGDSGGEAGSLEAAVFTPGNSDKTLVTLGVTMAAQDLEKAAAQFNRDSAGYRVEIVDYYTLEGNWDDAYEKLQLDVVTGKAPDVIGVSGIDYRVFAGKGVLTDLYGFMEGDGALSKSLLVQSALKAFEEEGHLYSISPSFQLHTMWGYADVTGGKSGVTFSELLRILEGSGKDFNAIGGFSADEPVLTTLCCAAMDEFVDWETGECEFDGDYFKEVLSFAENYHPGNGDLGYLEAIRDRAQVLSAGLISSVADYQLQKEIYGGNLDVIGYPSANGSGTAVDFRESPVAVNARSQNQAGAWEFVKFYLLQGYDGQGFPMMQERFDEEMEAAMKEDYTDSENGGQEKLPKAYYGGADGSIAVYAASREDVDAVRKLVESAQNRYEIHPAIQNIINEEAEGYLSGQVDLDRTVDKIQNRVSLLLQESR